MLKNGGSPVAKLPLREENGGWEWEHTGTPRFHAVSLRESCLSTLGLSSLICSWEALIPSASCS